MEFWRAGGVKFMNGSVPFFPASMDRALRGMMKDFCQAFSPLCLYNPWVGQVISF